MVIGLERFRQGGDRAEIARLRRGFGQKMSTFVSVKNTVDSMRYADFMSTFVYRVEKAFSGKSMT